MVQRDRGLVVRHGAEVLAGQVRDRQLALHLEGEDGRGGELLRDRAEVVHAVGRQRDAARAVSQAVGLLEQHVFPANGERPARESEALEASP